MRQPLITVVGPGEGAGVADVETAFELGAALGGEGWGVVCGGRGAGVMDAVCRGARSTGGLTVGVLPGPDASGASEAVAIAVVTGLGSGRNVINALTGDVVVACGMGPGTASEAALALKAGKDLVLLRQVKTTVDFFRDLAAGSAEPGAGSRLRVAATVAEAIEQIRAVLARRRQP